MKHSWAIAAPSHGCTSRRTTCDPHCESGTATAETRAAHRALGVDIERNHRPRRSATSDASSRYQPRAAPNRSHIGRPQTEGVLMDDQNPRDRIVNRVPTLRGPSRLRHDIRACGGLTGWLNAMVQMFGPFASHAVVAAYGPPDPWQIPDDPWQ